MENKKTLVLGATTNPERYSYLAVQKLRHKGHDVVAIGKHTGKVKDVASKMNTGAKYDSKAFKNSCRQFW